jgi:hypothetical protein
MQRDCKSLADDKGKRAVELFEYVLVEEAKVLKDDHPRRKESECTLAEMKARLTDKLRTVL